MVKTKSPSGTVSLFFRQLRRDGHNFSRWNFERKSFKSDLERLRAFRGKGQGSKVLLVANGPSAAQLPERFVSDFRASGGAVVGMNWAHLNPALVDGRVDYYVSADRRMVEEGEDSRSLRTFLEANRDVVAFVPEIRVSAWRDKFPETVFYPFCRYHVRYLRLPHWGDAPLYPKRFFAHTGLHSLQIASWMGFDRVFLTGFDNTYVTQMRPGEGNKKTQVVSYAGDVDKAASIQEDTVSFLVRQTRLFRDYWGFSSTKVRNLHAASLTDCFEYSSPSDALRWTGEA